MNKEMGKATVSTSLIAATVALTITGHPDDASGMGVLLILYLIFA